ncbi:MAG: inositol 2-dehydrogenase [Geminicoccaceae bacterium]|nr:inositol 2-dehydrogenase [Geminicoccaceae bacterium]
MLRFALFGAGRIGRMHADNLVKHPKAALAWVYDVVEASAGEVAKRHGAERASSVGEALADPAVDAVLIASSTDTHVDLIQAAVEAGKAVLCEKPIDLDIGRVDACWAAIRDRNPRVMLGFNRRFDPSFKAVRDACQAGEIGAVRQVQITSRDPEVPSVAYMKAAGGLLRDMTIHDFDLARYLLGEEPVRVACFAQALIAQEVRDLDDHDTAMVLLETAGGRQACITNYRRAVYGYDQRIEIVGETGMLKAENRRPTTVERWTKDRTEAKDPILHFFIERYQEAYNAEIGAFVEAVEAGAPMPVTFEDGRRALLLANAAYESLRTGAAVTVEE